MSLIHCQNVIKKYGSNIALNNVSFHVESGSPIALIGPNGAGKTTLFKLLCGFIPATSGDINILGERTTSSALTGKLAALPQDSVLDPSLSVAKQLQFFAQLQGFSKAHAVKESDRVLEMVELSHIANEKPTALSHGMSKRVAIAQAFIGKPKLILLDEPTAGIDPANAKQIRRIITEHQSSIDFLISSHNLDELEKLCDQVLYLDRGHLKQALRIQQHSDQQAYITLTMQQNVSESLLLELKQLDKVIDLELSDPHCIILQYQHDENSDIELHILTLLSKNKTQYKSIMRGRSLEDTLF
ncbi:MAG: ABC transporter ATP-binding protein [Parashewanella sp.]